MKDYMTSKTLPKKDIIATLEDAVNDLEERRSWHYTGQN